MKCKKCGYELEPGDKFCCNCGELVEQVEVKEPIFPDAKEAPLPGVSEIKKEEVVNGGKPEQTQVANSIEVQQEASPTTEKKKSNPIVLIIIIVLVIVAAILLFVLLYGSEGSKIASKTTTTTNTTTTTEPTTKKALLATEHVINSIKITVPNDWVYFDSTSETGTIVSQAVGLQINISPMDSVSFEYAKNDQTIIDNSLVAKGIQVINKNTIEYEGKEYFYYEVLSSNTNQVFLFTSMPNGNTIRFEVATPNADYNAAMPIINPIALSAEVY